jgi:hypothetical protein
MRGFGRTHIKALLRSGLRDLDAVRQASQEALAGTLGAGLAECLTRYLHRKRRRRPRQRRRPTADSSRASIAPEKEEASLARSARKDAPSAKLHFDGTPVKRRTVLRAGGRSCPVPNKTFSILLYLARQLKADGAGWVHKAKLGPNPQQVISSVRRDLRAALPDDGDVIENDGFGAYRLHVPPDGISFNWEQIRRHWDGKIARQAPKEVGKAAAGDGGPAPEVLAQH